MKIGMNKAKVKEITRKATTADLNVFFTFRCPGCGDHVDYDLGDGEILHSFAAGTKEFEITCPRCEAEIFVEVVR